MPGSRIAFIGTHIEIDGVTPIELVPGLVTLRRARDSEILQINQRLQFIRHTPPWPPYAYKARKTVIGTSNRWDFEEIPSSAWRYWVLAYDQSALNEADDLMKMMSLLSVDLVVALTMAYFEADQQGEPYAFSNPAGSSLDDLTNVDQPEPRTITSSELKSLITIAEHYRYCKANFSFICSAITTYENLKSISRRSPLYTVGLFSVIESLITHKPRSNETLDSVTHQLHSKMTLLRRMFSHEIRCTDYFPASAADKIWKTLYSYRSDIAHGTEIDYTKKFSVLTGPTIVAEFLRENIKEIIKICLDRPQFIADLREC